MTTKQPAKRTARKSKITKKETTRKTTAASPFRSPDATEVRSVRYTLSAFCHNAEDVEEGLINGDADAFRRACPIATHMAAYTRQEQNGRWVDYPEVLTICAADWHEHHPTCWICRSTDVELDPLRRQCVDGAACADRAQARLESDPRWEKWRQFRQDAEDRIAIEEARTPKIRKPRQPGQERPTSGRCEHCGEPTKGGRFVAGHDAKLKGDLIRAGAEGDVAAVAEAMARNWYKPGRYPDLEEAAFAMVQATETETLIKERTAERLGE